MCLGLRSGGWREEHIAQHRAADGSTATAETRPGLITAKHCENTHRSSTSIPASFFCPPSSSSRCAGNPGKVKVCHSGKGFQMKMSASAAPSFHWERPGGSNDPRALNQTETEIIMNWRFFFSPSLHQFISFSGIFSAVLLIVDCVMSCRPADGGFTAKFTFLPTWLPRF